MLFKSVFCVAAAAGSAMAAPTIESRAACKANKPIDTFADWANRTNSLGSVSGGMFFSPFLSFIDFLSNE